MDNEETACALVAIIGPPNAGKSTLVNRLAGTKISIVTPKPQTTRLRVRGICTEGNTQLVLTDTPGIFDGKQEFDRAMIREAWTGLAEADIALLMLDARHGLDETAQLIIAKLHTIDIPLVLALNKVDAVQKPYLLALATAAQAAANFEQIFMISAQTGSGVDDVRRWLAQRAPKGPWLYPEDQPTDQNLRQIAAELTREQLFLLLRQELPYGVAVETDGWEDQKNGTARVQQTIYVEREGQKKIVIGAGGAMLKKIGSRARKAISELAGRRVHLELFVKVDEHWKEKHREF